MCVLYVFNVYSLNQHIYVRHLYFKLSIYYLIDFSE